MEEKKDLNSNPGNPDSSTPKTKKKSRFWDSWFKKSPKKNEPTTKEDGWNPDSSTPKTPDEEAEKKDPKKGNPLVFIVPIIALLAIIIGVVLFPKEKPTLDAFATPTSGVAPLKATITVSGNFVYADIRLDDTLFIKEDIAATKTFVQRPTILGAGKHKIVVRGFWKKGENLLTKTIEVNVTAPPADTTNNSGGNNGNNGGSNNGNNGGGNNGNNGGGNNGNNGGGNNGNNGGGNNSNNGGGNNSNNGGGNNGNNGSSSINFDKNYDLSQIDIKTANNWKGCLVNGPMTVNRRDVLLSYRVQDGNTTMVFLNLSSGANAPTKNVYIKLSNLVVK